MFYGLTIILKVRYIFKTNEGFSVVIPVYKELEMIPITLSSYLSLYPDEIIMCMDKDDYPEKELVKKVINKTFCDFMEENRLFYDGIHFSLRSISKLKILEIERNKEYGYHQAWVRRRGFLEAKNNIVVTGDIDLIVNARVLNAVELVASGKYGLVSIMKMRLPRNLTGFYRAFVREIMRRLGTRRFTGLYAFNKKRWIETEGDSVKKMVSAKKSKRITKDSARDLGEDTFLKNRMEKKYDVLFLGDIGAVDLQIASVDLPVSQFVLGKYAKEKRYNILRVIVHTVLNLHPFYLMGYFS